MPSFVEALMQQLDERGVADQVAGKLGIPPSRASSAIAAGVPAILAGLARNTQKSDGVASLSAALDKDHDGSVLDDATYFDSYMDKKGEGILGHVFGGQSNAVQSQVSTLGGLDAMQGGELLKMLAPLVMGYLGKEKSSGGLDIGSLSQILMGGGGGGSGGLQLPGGLSDILGGLAGGGPVSASKKQPTGLGLILGKLFKKR